ncbi:hypothetical protein O181_004790 [Austropuccinia psidii MF-1]|uniref:CCHC-type domain-containing protein n=1 Tax=Austropuccinia psidii MF-1 TaxID=1389203 RepID=A0A9Q3BHR0_9BASI|nr:hypothetical protein [Austropuccinia psidii MF-1]
MTFPTPFKMVENQDKPRENVAEVTKSKKSCHNCGSRDHYAKNCQKKKKKIYAIEQVPEEEIQAEDSESYPISYCIRENSDDDQDPIEEFLVEHQEATQLKIQEIQLEAGLPQDTANRNLCKHTQDVQTLLVTPTKGMGHIHEKATKMTICVENAQSKFIIDNGVHFSIFSKEYWENQLFQTKAKSFESESGKMTSIGTIIKEIIITHRKGNIKLNPEFLVLEDSHIQKFLLGTDYQRIYGIDIYKNKNRNITIGTKKEK